MISLYQEITQALNKILVDFGGGCSVEKAYTMATLIVKYELKNTIDIGVYRGRSLFPQAIAHKRLNNDGIVYGVDPWSQEEAKEYDNEELFDRIHSFVDTTNFQSVYEDVQRLLDELNLARYCKIIRSPSAQAIDYFIDQNIYFDLIHIDGNHDTKIVMEDVNLYLPRLKDNGFLVLDDISWSSVKPAFDEISNQLTIIMKHSDYYRNDYAIFWKNKSTFDQGYLKIFLGILNLPSKILRVKFIRGILKRSLRIISK